MKDKELKFEEVEASHTLGGAVEGGVQAEEVFRLSEENSRGLAPPRGLQTRESIFTCRTNWLDRCGNVA
jgi:hypothetical protein